MDAWLFVLLAVVPPTAAGGEGLPPLRQADSAHAALTRYRAKPVHDARLLDDMESLAGWTAEGRCSVELTADRARDGRHSVRLTTTTRTPDDTVLEQDRWYGYAQARRSFPGEDWRGFNRLSFWVFPRLPGWFTVNLRVRLYNEGAVAVPAGFYPVYHCFDLRNEQWNHVVWEIGDLPRDRVTGVELWTRRQGNEPGAADVHVFDIDRLELQRVDPEHVEGWSVAPGRIAFSHSGYAPASRKRALWSGDDPGRFAVVDETTGRAVLEKATTPAGSRLGAFTALAFDELATPGRYRLRVASHESPPFEVAASPWDGTVGKVLSFFRGERCGIEVPGVHRVCHRDWRATQGGRSIVINGGWHDAGDLSQGVMNTAEAVRAMVHAAETQVARGGDPRLVEELLAEARWGLDWVMKTSFRDGYRLSWSTLGPWTDGIIGTNDDVTTPARRSARASFVAAMAEAAAARAFAERDPVLAADARQRAEEDWRFGLEETRAKDDEATETSAYGVLAGVELLRLTGDARYGESAAFLAERLLAAQEGRVLPGLDLPLAGYFYTSPGRKQILHYVHWAADQAPIDALASLAGALPHHPAFPRWYAAVVLHSEHYARPLAGLTEPWHVLPNGLHRLQGLGTVGEDAVRREQVRRGFPVGDDAFVRVFPVQPQGEKRGHFPPLLSFARAVSIAAHLRQRADLLRLAEEQMQWVVGRNPFGQSTLYGEGYDFQPLYSAMSGDLVGALPVGIKSRENEDAPYWPTHNHANYKEVWVHPASRWLSLAADVGGTGCVRFQLDAPAEACLTERVTRERRCSPVPAGGTELRLPWGDYDVEIAGARLARSLLPGRTVEVDLRAGRLLDARLEGCRTSRSRIRCRLSLAGDGDHGLEFVGHNLELPPGNRRVRLSRDATSRVTIEGRLLDDGAPWVLLVRTEGRRLLDAAGTPPRDLSRLPRRESLP